LTLPQQCEAASKEDDCLHWFPFADDFGAPGDRVLEDKVVTARKAGACFDCTRPINPGERIRTMSAKFDGELRRYRWCALCCEAMAAEDPTEAMEARLALRDSSSASGLDRTKGAM
jgi:hypothetical protein